jgi:hypothetical protein
MMGVRYPGAADQVKMELEASEQEQEQMELGAPVPTKEQNAPAQPRRIDRVVLITGVPGQERIPRSEWYEKQQEESTESITWVARQE